MKVFLFVLCFVIPFQIFAVDTNSSEKKQSTCQIIFSNSPLDHERYTESSLKKWMASSNYRKIMEIYPVLELEIENNLFRLYQQQNSERAFQILFLSNIRLIYFLMTKYVKPIKDIHDDLIQVGLQALLHLFNTFDLERGAKFSSYAASAIPYAMKRYMQTDRQIPMRMTEYRRRLYNLLKKKSSNISDISENSIMEFMEEYPEFSIEDIRHMLLMARNKPHVSLTAPLGNSENYTLLDVISTNGIDIERGTVYKMDLQKIYDWIIEKTRKRKQSSLFEVIIKDRLFSQNPKTLQDIAEQFNITRQAVQQNEKIIVEMIKKRFKGYNK